MSLTNHQKIVECFCSRLDTPRKALKNQDITVDITDDFTYCISSTLVQFGEYTVHERFAKICVQAVRDTFTSSRPQKSRESLALFLLISHEKDARGTEYSCDASE